MMGVTTNQHRVLCPRMLKGSLFFPTQRPKKRYPPLSLLKHLHAVK
ncbi:hypothetical protein Goarm_013966 [Gossypium armourianum]|uniref:Uncharacterized protein n=1 Tax=Gossypium armourianum TaxID=34283 RepID=A0A7J9J4V8_9ROSI|nr:hypothetical protein [Gossypium armourianum]